MALCLDAYLVEGPIFNKLISHKNSLICLILKLFLSLSENADINVFLETSVDTSANGLHNSYLSSEEDIKPFSFEGQNGFDRELESNINEMSIATTKGPPMIDYESLGRRSHPQSENGECPTYPSASYSQSHSSGKFFQV